MTPEEACEYLGISLDGELDINIIERNYTAKLSECGDDAEQRAKIEDACNALIEIYDELYGNAKSNTVEKHHDSLVMKLTLVMAGVFLLSFAGGMYFLYKVHIDSKAPQNEVVSTAEYERLRREIESMRKRQEERPAPQVAVNNSPADYTTLVERAMPSMVFIQTDKATGSGFFVSPNGDILTNHHVIEGAGYITVTAQNGQSVGAMVKDYDAQRDIALLKVNTSYALPFLTISNTLPKQGEAVIAIGNPRGLNGSVSSGIVAAVREIDNNLWVQFTAPISPGSSGGALLNIKGEVVGMPTWIKVAEATQNLNFGVPSTVLAQFLSSAINKPAQALPQPKKPSVASRPQPKPTPSIADIPGVKFVRKDDGYDMYLLTQSIEYDRETQAVSFITLWLPTEKSKREMRKDPHFKPAPTGEDLGSCLLVYNVNFQYNTYIHLRTVNFFTDGSVARDYIKPSDEIRWRKAPKGSRIESLMKEVKKQLRIR